MKLETWEFVTGFVLQYIPNGSYQYIVFKKPELHYTDQKWSVSYKTSNASSWVDFAQNGGKYDNNTFIVKVGLVVILKTTFKCKLNQWYVHKQLYICSAQWTGKQVIAISHSWENVLTNQKPTTNCYKGVEFARHMGLLGHQVAPNHHGVIIFYGFFFF